MKRYQLAAIAAVFGVAIFSLNGRGQQAPPPGQPGGQPVGAPPPPAAGEGMMGGFSVMLPPPLTRLEALAAQKNVVVVRGFTDIGTLVTDDTSSVLISAVQFTDGDSKEQGIAVHVSQPVEGRTIQTVAYVDEAEIDGLIAAVNKIAQLQDGASPLQQHIGLGTGASSIDVEITWPVGRTTQRFMNVPRNRILRVQEGNDRYTEVNRSAR